MTITETPNELREAKLLNLVNLLRGIGSKNISFDVPLDVFNALKDYAQSGQKQFEVEVHNQRIVFHYGIGVRITVMVA